MAIFNENRGKQVIWVSKKQKFDSEHFFLKGQMQVSVFPFLDYTSYCSLSQTLSKTAGIQEILLIKIERQRIGLDKKNCFRLLNQLYILYAPV